MSTEGFQIGRRVSESRKANNFLVKLAVDIAGNGVFIWSRVGQMRAGLEYPRPAIIRAGCYSAETGQQTLSPTPPKATTSDPRFSARVGIPPKHGSPGAGRDSAGWAQVDPTHDFLRGRKESERSLLCAEKRSLLCAEKRHKTCPQTAGLTMNGVPMARHRIR